MTKISATRWRTAMLLAAGWLPLLGACSGGSGEARPAPGPAAPAVPGNEAPPGGGQPVGGAPAPLPGAPPPAVVDEFLLAGYSPAPASVPAAAVFPGMDGSVADPPHETPDAVLLARANRDALYVSPKGIDSNPGTADRPFRSLARAARAVRAGITVYVAPGAYGGGVRTNASGRADARITYVSTTKWGARIVPPPNSQASAAWDNRGDYADVVGFEIDGRGYREGVRWTHGIYNGGSYDSIRNNYIHHIAQNVDCTPGGGAAIGIDSYYRAVKSDAIANLLHDIGPAGCHYIQGIYFSTSGSVKNNVIYRVAEAGIHLWHDANNVVITNNTVTASNTGIIVGGGNFYHTKGPNDHTMVYSNIVYDNKMGISEQGRTGANNSYRNNLVYRNARFNWSLKNGLAHSGTVSSPPLFVGGDASVPNLKPSGSSPAVGQASPTHAASTDFEGRSRNSRTGFDIGAYQH
ncbi:DUF1565 domain-containing protein [Massilia polaris]|nr:DUF1565 domain-containing protein [Massilia polaris]